MSQAWLNFSACRRKLQTSQNSNRLRLSFIYITSKRPTKKNLRGRFANRFVGKPLKNPQNNIKVLVPQFLGNCGPAKSRSVSVALAAVDGNVPTVSPLTEIRGRRSSGRLRKRCLDVYNFSSELENLCGWRLKCPAHIQLFFREMAGTGVRTGARTCCAAGTDFG